MIFQATVFRKIFITQATFECLNLCHEPISHLVAAEGQTDVEVEIISQMLKCVSNPYKC